MLKHKIVPFVTACVILFALALPLYVSAGNFSVGDYAVVPQTGDDATIVILCVAAILLTALLVAVVIIKKRTNDKDSSDEDKKDGDSK